MREFEPARRLRGIEKSMIRQIFDRARPGSINLGLGEPDLPTPEVIRRAAVRVIEEEQNGYTSHAGLPALRERVASDYPHLRATPDQVIIAAGSQEALYLALLTLVDEGDEVLLPDPGFVAYPTIVRMAGAAPSSTDCPPRRVSPSTPKRSAALSRRTRRSWSASVLQTHGRVLSREDFRAMAKRSKARNARVVSDEIYRELYYAEERPASASEFCRSGRSRQRPLEVSEHDGVASGLALRRATPRRSKAPSSSTATSRPAPRPFAEGGARRLDGRGRSGARRSPSNLPRAARPSPRITFERATPARRRARRSFYTMVDVSVYGDSMRVAETS